MSRGIKIAVIVIGIAVVLPIGAAVVLFVGGTILDSRFNASTLQLFNALTRGNPSQILRREVQLANHGTLIIDGKARGQSEHGFSQRAGYRQPGSTQIEWFGDVSDGVEPQVYQAGPLVVVIDLPAAQLYVRTHGQNWKNLALVFPNDLGPFPISFYAERSGLSMEEISRINALGGQRERKYPTTYIQSFDPATRDLKCSYQVDNKSSWPLHLRLSEDGTHLALVAIGSSSP